MATKFPRHTEVRFKDTRGCGGITVRGIQLESDEDGFVEGPPDLAADIEPHGFVAEEKWFKALPDRDRLTLARKDERYHTYLNHAEMAKIQTNAKV